MNTIRSLIVVLVLSLILGACGASEEAGSDTSATRTLTGRYGEITVPAAPQRVVTLDEGALDALVAVGVTPVGAITSRVSDGVAPYIRERAANIAIVGTPAETNLEAVVAAQPDLILAPSRLDEEQYAKLSAIAPTFVASAGISDWRTAVREYAGAVGKSEQIEAVLKGIDARIAELKGKLPAQGASAAVVRWQPQGPAVMSRMLSSVTMLEELGLAMPPIVDTLTDVPHSDILSLEALADVDTDWLFVATFNAEADQAVASVREQPAFARLKAAQSDHVVMVNGQLWSSAYGPLATQAMLDDVEKALTDGLSQQ